MSTFIFNRRDVFLAGAILMITGLSAHAQGKTHNVTIKNLSFLPADITVKPGDVIIWTNEEPFAHTATVKNGWEVMIPPKHSVSRPVGADDTVAYYCRFHPNMKGKINVEQ